MLRYSFMTNIEGQKHKIFLDPIRGLQCPTTPSCWQLATLSTGAPLILIALLTFEIRPVLILIRRSLCCKQEPLL